MSHGSATSTGERPAAELEAIAQRLLTSLTTTRVWSLSLHDEHADVLWLADSVLGPDEHEAVRASLEVFAGEGAPERYEYDLGDGRVAVTYRASHSGGSVLGVAMVIADHKSIASKSSPLGEQSVAALRAPLDEFAKWLRADVSATQLRLRALPAMDLVELQLQPDPPPPGTVVAPAAPPAAAATAAVAARSSPVAPVAAPVAASVATAAAVASIDPALDRHFAALRAQPIVLYAQRLEPMAKGSRIRRFEILLRTGSGHGATQAPTAMLEAAAKRGLGSVVDRRVVTDLVVWLARNPEVWRADPVVMSVNLSSTALADLHFLKFLELCLAKADLPRGMIAFELDASYCGQHLAQAHEFAQFLAALGCTVILDDFMLRDGAAELLDLKGLRMLKLDRRATANIGSDKRQQAVVAGIAQMACVLGMHTCAKAIETSQDARLLAALKVDFVQGYGFAVPAPLSALATPAAPVQRAVAPG